MEQKFISEIQWLRPWSIGAIYWAALGELRVIFEVFFERIFFSEGEQGQGGEHDDIGCI